MQSHIPDFLTNLILIADTSLLIGVIIAFLWVVRRLAKQDSSARMMAFIAPLFVLLWFGVALFLGYQNFFKATFDGPLPPYILYGIMGPLFLFAPVVFWSNAFGRILDQFAQEILVGYQSYRMLGILFFVAYGASLLPAIFTYPAGIGDILTGLFALLTALVYWRHKLAAAGLVRIWNYFGIADLMLAVSLGFLSSPGIFLILSTDAPNEMITAYPLVLVPVFAVPMSILLHFASLRKLRRDLSKEKERGEEHDQRFRDF